MRTAVSVVVVVVGLVLVSAGCFPGQAAECSGDPENPDSCADTCTDLQTDVENCGICNNICRGYNEPGASAACVGGRCQAVCEGEGNEYCPDEPQLGEEWECTDVTSDAESCGGCFDECLAVTNGEITCNDGECDLECDDGFEECDGSCIAGDHALHCGGCNQACNGDEYCEAGQCVDAAPCDPDATFGSGEGTDASPYGICTKEQLRNIEDHLTDTFVLRADLDFDGDEPLVPIGRGYQEDHVGIPGGWTEHFEGTFIGAGHEISNLTIDHDYERIGLFGRVAEWGLVSDVHLVDPDVRGSEHVGALVGMNLGTVRNSTVRGARVDGNHNVGGAIGFHGGSARRISSNGIVTATEEAAGGLVGELAGQVTQSFSNAGIDAPDSEAVGGLAGILAYHGELADSYATGNVIGYRQVGGLVGLLDSRYRGGARGEILDSYATGTVTGEIDPGGLIGAAHGDVERSYWNTETSGLSRSSAGTGRTSAEFSDAATFSGWDFDEIWEMDSERPVLQWASQ